METRCILDLLPGDIKLSLQDIKLSLQDNFPKLSFNNEGNIRKMKQSLVF